MPPKRKQNRRNTNRKKSVNPLAKCLLPLRILAFILCRLPVKSLVRFSRVCRPWSNLFTNPAFINMQYNHPSPSPQTSSKSNILDLSTLGLIPTNNSSNTDPTAVGDTFLGSCRGLLCIARPSVTSRILLWNPATRLWKILPDSNEDFGVVEMASLGFGCNEAGDDYKVVRFLSLEGRVEKVGMEVYSSQSDSWATMVTATELGFSFRLQSNASNTTVKGNPFWIVYREADEKMILMKFDATDMSITTTEIPTEASDGSRWRWVDWEDQLAGLECVRREDEGVIEFIDVWVYDESENLLRRNVRLGNLMGWNVCRCVDYNWKNGVIVGKCKNGGVFALHAKSGSVVALEKEGKDSDYYCRILRHDESLGYVEGMTQMEFTEDNQITEKCSADGFLACIRRQGTKIEVYYALRF